MLKSIGCSNGAWWDSSSSTINLAILLNAFGKTDVLYEAFVKTPHWLSYFGFPSRVRAVAYSDAAFTMSVKVPRIPSDWAWHHRNDALLVEYLAHGRKKILTDALGIHVSSI